MDVLVDGDGTGKTTLLLDWLYGGQAITPYPGWSRAVVCAHAERVPAVTGEAWRRFGSGPWVKCIFTLREWKFLFRGILKPGMIEYAVDDVDVFIGEHLGVPQPPSLVTMTGSAAYR